MNFVPMLIGISTLADQPTSLLEAVLVIWGGASRQARRNACVVVRGLSSWLLLPIVSPRALHRDAGPSGYPRRVHGTISRQTQCAHRSTDGTAPGGTRWVGLCGSCGRQPPRIDKCSELCTEPVGRFPPPPLPC